MRYQINSDDDDDDSDFVPSVHMVVVETKLDWQLVKFCQICCQWAWTPCTCLIVNYNCFSVCVSSFWVQADDSWLRPYDPTAVNHERLRKIPRVLGTLTDTGLDCNDVHLRLLVKQMSR